MDPRAAFLSQTDARFFLSEQSPEETESYLRQQGWIEADENLVNITRPGEGNMNRVLRITTDHRSIILKQSRPWVEKYPQIEAPVDRSGVEARFYSLIRQDAYLQKMMPKLLGQDEDNHLLLLEDLGHGADFTFIYRKGAGISEKHLDGLMTFLTHLHNRSFSREATQAFPDNQDMRRLNHEHLFVFPFTEENGFDLDTIQPGLQAAARPYRNDPHLKERLAALGALYLGKGHCLLHGDFFPGSWLRVGDAVKIIDPEFCFFGPPEYDLGIAVAHLLMAQTPDALIWKALRWYDPPEGFNADLRRAFTGMEIMRRLIGLAQLPVDLTLAEKQDLLTMAAVMVKEEA